MNKFLVQSALILAFLGLGTFVLADFELSKWMYQKEIRFTPITTGSKLVSFTLDGEVFNNSKEGLADLRIIDSNNKETAYKLLVEKVEQLRQSFPVRIVNLGSGGEYTQLTLDLGKEGIIHNSVTFSTTSINFRRQVEVEASADATNWFLIKKASEGAYIYDYSLDFKAKNTTVYYPESTYRYLRLKIIDSGEEPIKIGGATVYYNVSTSAYEVTYKPKILEKKEDKETRSTQIILDLEAKGVPSNQIKLTTNEVNFNREVAVEGSNNKTDWSQLGARDVIFSYQTPKFVGLKTNIVYPESNFRYLRLTVFNRDNQPISFGDFSVWGTLRKVLFQAEPNLTYKLFYGNPKARFAEYDLESYLQYLDTSTAADAILGAGENNSAFAGEIPPKKPLTERYPYLLSGVLAVLVVILGSMVLRLAFQVKSRR